MQTTFVHDEYDSGWVKENSFLLKLNILKTYYFVIKSYILLWIS